MITALPNLRNKQELLRSMEEAQNQPPDPMAIRGAQAEVAKVEAEVRKTDADAVLKMSQAQAAQQPEAPQAPEPGMSAARGHGDPRQDRRSEGERDAEAFAGATGRKWTPAWRRSRWSRRPPPTRQGTEHGPAGAEPRPAHEIEPPSLRAIGRRAPS